MHGTDTWTHGRTFVASFVMATRMLGSTVIYPQAIIMKTANGHITKFSLNRACLRSVRVYVAASTSVRLTFVLRLTRNASD
jgi:hypothetical protein